MADVDDVRAALGYERVSLYGGWYGTRMGQAHAPVCQARAVGGDRRRRAIRQRHSGHVRRERPAIDRAGVGGVRHEHRLPLATSADRGGFRWTAASAGRGPRADDLLAAGTSVTVPFSRGDFGYAVRGILYRADSVSRLPDMIGRAAASGDFGIRRGVLVP